MRYKVKQVKKAVVGLVGSSATLVVSFVAENANWLSEEAAGTLGVAGVVLTSIGVFLAKNEKVIDDVIEYAPE